jgi:hypothetical protein
MVIASPNTSSMKTAVDNIIYCSNQGTNSLTFSANTTPSSTVTFNVLFT